MPKKNTTTLPLYWYFFGMQFSNCNEWALSPKCVIVNRSFYVEIKFRTENGGWLKAEATIFCFVLFFLFSSLQTQTEIITLMTSIKFILWFYSWCIFVPFDRIHTIFQNHQPKITEQLQAGIPHTERWRGQHSSTSDRTGWVFPKIAATGCFPLSVSRVTVCRPFSSTLKDTWIPVHSTVN